MPEEKLKNLDVLLVGQLVTSRTETIESYLKDRVNALGVIGFSSVYSLKNVSRCSNYRQGRVIKEFKFPVFLIKNSRPWKQPLLLIYFLGLSLNILLASFKLKKKYEAAVGVACFSTLLAIILKKLGIVKKVIYYTIDYYIKPKTFGFSSILIYIIKHADKFCVRRSEVVWNISSRIPEGREKIGGLSPDTYHHCLVPMCYDRSLLRVKDDSLIEKNVLGFVGTLSHNQGLQLLLEAMPEIIKKAPRVKVKIIGHGPYAQDIKDMVKKNKLDDYFIFYGFMEKESEVLDILSRCALGLAVWTSSEDDNAIYADPGKPKLYAFCGIPSIITKTPEVAELMHREKAGIAINYDKEELVKAVLELLLDEKNLIQYRRFAFAFAQKYTSDIVYDKAWRESLGFLESAK